MPRLRLLDCIDDNEDRQFTGDIASMKIRILRVRIVSMQVCSAGHQGGEVFGNMHSLTLLESVDLYCEHCLAATIHTH